MQREVVVFKGVRYYRYPDKTERSRHLYYASKKRPSDYLHQAIWKDANGPIPAGHQIHHKDGNPLNNALDNLECLSPLEHKARHYEEFACTYCGKQFTASNVGRNRFCSAECRMKEFRRSGNCRDTRKCAACGGEFKVLRQSKTAHCSLQCAWVSRRLKEAA
jgi:hypothetical protein